MKISITSVQIGFLKSAVINLLFFTVATVGLAQENKSEAREPISAAEMGDASPFGAVAFGQGVQFRAADNSLSMNLRFRMQNRADFFWLDEEPQSGSRYSDEWQVRRTRLRFNGHVISPRLRYLLQLSFSRADQDWDNSQVPNVLRDAMILYDVTDNWQVGFGQGKLPGNRQRVVSSGDLQFVDRSLLNARFNIDRDFGFQTQYRLRFGEAQRLLLKGSITSGESRNRNVENDQRSVFVGRAEWLPLGEFERNGDYFEGDLAFEKTLKLSLAYTAAALPGAARENGTIGRVFRGTDGNGDPILFRRSQTVQFVDFLAKWRGWALSGEWARRDAEDPLITNQLAVLAGQGFNLQFSKMLTDTVEVAIRRTEIRPIKGVQSVHAEETDSTLVLSKYLNGHRTKLQAEIGHEDAARDRSYLRLQFELGI